MSTKRNKKENILDALEPILTTDRIVKVEGMITPEYGKKITDRLFALDVSGLKYYPPKPLLIFINSEGGNIPAGFSIISAMKLIKCPFVTFSGGLSNSAAALILMHKKAIFRVADENSRILIHEVYNSDVPDYEMLSPKGKKEIDSTNEQVARYISDSTGQNINKVKKDMKEETSFSAKEALDYGIVQFIG